MAQIKKYQSGGTAPSGKFIKDGKEFAADENFFRQLDTYAQSLDEEQRLHLADIRDALKRGETVTYDSYRNEISPNINFSNINDRQNQRLEGRPTKAGSFIDAVFNTGRQQGAKTISSLRDFNIKEQVTPITPKQLNFTRASIDYNKGEDGNNIFSNNPMNQSIIDRISGLIDYYGMGDEGANAYRVSGIDNDAVKSFHQNNPERLSQVLNNIRNASLNDEDWDILNSLNIYDKQATNAVKSAVATANVEPPKEEGPTLQTVNGFNNDLLKNGGINLQQDNEGNVYWVNADADWYLGGHEAFAGTPYSEGVVYNGRLYTPQQVQNTQEVTDRFRDFYNAWSTPDLDYNDRFNLASQTGINFVGSGQANPFSQSYNPRTEYFDAFHDYFSTLPNNEVSTYNVADLTSMFDTGEGQLLSYISDSSKRNYLGIPIPSYVYRDNNSNVFTTYNDLSNIPFKRRQGFYTPQQLQISDWEEKGGKKYGLWRTLKSGDGENYIYIDEKGKKYVKTGKTYQPILNDTLLQQLLKDPTKATRVNVDRLRIDPTGRTRTNSQGIEHQDQYDFIRNGPVQRSDGTWTRKTDTRIYQYGGVIQNSQTNINRQQLPNTTTGSITNGAKLKDIATQGSEALTAADKWQLGAIAGDLGALIASLPTGGNPVAAGIGAGSTISQFVSDVKRDGLDWGDVGRGIGSLALDALTLVPGAGTFAKSAKTIKMLKRASKVLGTAFASYGLSAAGSSLAKLVKDGDNNDWTIDDLRNVLVGVQSVIGGKRMFLDKRLATKPGVRVKQKTPEGITLNSKSNKGLEVKLSNSELSELSNLRGNARNKRFQELVIDKATNSKISGDRALNIENYLNTDGTVNAKATTDLLKDFGLNNNTIASKLAIWNRNKTLSIPKENKGRFFQRAERTPRELRELGTGATGLGPQIGQSLRNRAIRRYSVNNPTAQNQIGVREGWLTGRDIPIYDRVRYTGKGITGRNLGRGQVFNVENPSTLVPTRTQTGVGTDGQPIYQFFSNSDRNNNAYQNVSELINYLKSYKKGGKVDKFHVGGRYPWAAPLDPNDLYGLDPSDPDFAKFYHAPTRGQTNGTPTTTGTVPTRTVNSGRSRTGTTASAPITRKTFEPVLSGNLKDVQLIGPTIQPLDVSRAKLATSAPTSTGVGATSKNGFFRNVNLPKVGADDLISLGQLGLSQIFNRRTTNVRAKAIKDAMKAGITAPQEIYPRFTDYGVNDAYETAARRELQTGPSTTSDPLLSRALKQDSNRRAEQLRLEGRLKTSELFSNYQNQTNELRRNYAGIRNDVANQNRQRIAQLNMALSDLKAGQMTNNFTSINNFLLEKRHQLAEDKQKAQQYGDVIARNNAEQRFQQTSDTLFAPYRDQFTQLSPEQQQQYGNWENYLRISNPQEYNNIMQQANNNRIKSLVPYFNSNIRFKSNKIKYAKGGKTTSKKQLNASEQIWVNQNKDAAKAVQQLNENILKLFLKATS